MWVGLLAGLGVAHSLPRFAGIFKGSEVLGVVLGATAMVATFLIDDVRKMSAPAKLAGQVLAGSLLASQGVQMLYFRVPFWDVLVLDQGNGFVITVAWVIVVSNAVNLIDGLDGLAAGIAAIAGLGFFVYSNRQVNAGLLSSQSLGPLLAAIVVGICLGFLPHNVHPAKIFMGDTGAMLLGLLLATSTLVVGGRTADDFSGQTFFFFAPVFIPFVILGVPLLDTALSFARRVIQRRAFHIADREHLHYRLERIGHGHARAVRILWAWTAVLGLVVVAPTFAGPGDRLNVLVLPGILALGVGLFTVLHPQVRAAAKEADVEERLIREATGEVPIVRIEAQEPEDRAAASP